MLITMNVISFVSNIINTTLNDSIHAWDLVEVVTNSTFRAPFFTRVDQFSQLMLKGSGATFYRNASTYVWLSVGAVTSPLRLWSDGDSYVGYYSAIVRMEEGRVIGISWDEGCKNCPDDICIGGQNCGLSYGSSYVPCFTDECNMKVYVAWVGTTTNQRQCLSGGFLPSNFRRFSLGNVRRDASRLSGEAVANLRDDPASGDSGQTSAYTGEASASTGANPGPPPATGRAGHADSVNDPTSTGGGWSRWL